MNRFLILLAAVLGAASLGLAQTTTMPAVQQPVKVLIIPFGQIGGTGGHEWVGAAIQESLMTEAAGDPAVQAVGMDKPVAASDIVNAARDAGAVIAVSGNFQYAGDQLRVTGQVVDVSIGRVMTTLKATGALTDLFKLEDTLSGQLQAVLPQQQPSNLPAVSYGAQQSAVPYYTSNDNAANEAVAAPQATYVAQPPVVYTSPYDYGYAYPTYGYPYYYAGYPYYYGGYPVFIGGGWGYGRGWYGGGFRPGFGFHGGFVGGHGGGGFHGGFGGGFHGGGFGGGHR